MTNSVIIAIDGPGSAGKGTLAQLLATHFDYAYLDTGSLYRGVAHLVVSSGGNPENVQNAHAAAKALNPDMINQQAIRTTEIGMAAAQVGAIAEVREEILNLQRHFAHTPPHNKKGAVLDGRDIGTTVCPQADVKIFVTAQVEIRAYRRWLELRKINPDLEEAQVLADLKQRDRLDTQRSIAPLKPAADALLLDTSDLAIEGAVKIALAFIDGS